MNKMKKITDNETLAILKSFVNARIRVTMFDVPESFAPYAVRHFDDKAEVAMILNMIHGALNGTAKEAIHLCRRSGTGASVEVVLTCEEGTAAYEVLAI